MTEHLFYPLKKRDYHFKKSKMPPINNLRKYGTAPFSVAVVHGGPGAAGEMAMVARTLALQKGVLEPMQTAISIKGQVLELKRHLKENGNLPVFLIGFSWGAMLSLIFTATHPSFVQKLILISSGPIEEKHANSIESTRAKRLDGKEIMELRHILKKMNQGTGKNKIPAFSRLGALIAKADTYQSVETTPEPIDYRPDIFESIWTEASTLRQNGEFLRLSKRINCPVVAIHGDFDPHPADSIKESLSKTIQNFRFVLLKSCGHMPWLEAAARDRFFDILKREIN